MLQIDPATLSHRPITCTLFLAMCSSLIVQLVDLRDLLDEPPKASIAPEVNSARMLDTHTATLFGSPPPRQFTPQSQHIRLLACFVQTDSRHSIALLTLDDQRPRRVREGEEIAEGLYLQRIEERRIVVSRQGQSSTLSLHGSLAMAGLGQ